MFRRHRPAPLLGFDEVRRRLTLGTRVDEGTQTIAISSIIGSVGRRHEFDGAFRPRTERLRSVLREIARADPNAVDTPITVYRVDHAYFVVDGHKRLSLAIANGREAIEAEVSHFATRYHVAPGVAVEELRLTEAEERFREETGLARAEPELRFPLSDPGGFLDLEESVKAHAYDLSRREGRLLSPEDAARHWIEHVYRPSLEVLRLRGRTTLLPSCTDADLFLIKRQGNVHPFDAEWRLLESGVDHGLANVDAVSRAGRLRVGRRRGKPRVLPRREPP